MKLQADIPDKLNKKLKIYRIDRGLINLEEVVIEIIKRYFELVESDLRDPKGNKIAFEE